MTRMKPLTHQQKTSIAKLPLVWSIEKNKTKKKKQKKKKKKKTKKKTKKKKNFTVGEEAGNDGDSESLNQFTRVKPPHHEKMPI